MAVIDVGPGATDRGSTRNGGTTYVDLNNAANDTGTIDAMYVWVNQDATGAKCGTFSGSSSSYTPRDYESLGSIASGAERSFTGLNCDVTSGDFLGYYHQGDDKNRIEADSSGYSGVYYKSGDQFNAGTQTYSLYANYAISIYATGATAKAPMQNAIPAVLALLMN